MTTHTRAARARRDRTQTLTALTGRLDRIAAGSTAHLTPAEAALLAETVRALQADAHHLAQDRRGLARARSAGIEKLKAAEAVIREAEQGLDDLVSAVRSAVHIADDHDVTDWQRGYRACACRVLTTLVSLQQNPPVIVEEHTLTDDQMTEIANVVNSRPHPNVHTFGTTSA
ncbi:hypothetical protein J3A78_003845 [Streptomyces sp. PvR006]|uniref:hypothetical protein n=1 Tax=Streptomyces sp. PvR006 TaxID=2817860 RepID=UPI001AE39C1C|nr:hypothetical protein [Streptomyces sp. PvR006]MBP2583367.1 hypothetical protein [Streptomyces sp. PvR006]